MPDPYVLDQLGLPEASELRALVRRFPDIEPLAYRDGEYLVRQDETSQDIYVVLAGALVVEHAAPASGRPPAVLACLTASPEAVVVVGEMAYLGAQRRTASVRSSGRSHALRLAPAHVDGILAGFPELTRVICRQFSRRLGETDRALRQLQDLFALTPRQRLVQPGERLFAPGDPGGELLQLVTGTVRLEQGGSARLVSAADLPDGFLEPGAYLRGAAHRDGAVVEELAFLAVIGPEDREAVVRRWPGMALRALAASQSN